MTQLFNLNGGNEITSLDGAYGFYVVTVDSEGAPLQSGFVTLDTLKTFINTDPSVVPSSNPWRGCRVSLTADQSIASGSSFSTVSWQTAEIDTDEIWSIGAPTRLTVPIGVTKVRVSINLLWALNGTGLRFVTTRMNGSTQPGAASTVAPGSSTSQSSISASSAVMEVSAGDYFELRVAQNSGSALNIQAPDGRTWFEMEIVEASA